MKKITAFLILFIFAFGIMPKTVLGEEDFKLKVTSYGITKGDITKGDQIDFDIEVYNTHSSKITDVMIVINTNAFKPLDGENVYKAAELRGDTPKSFTGKKLVYDGSNVSKIEIIIGYSDESGEHSKVVYIPVKTISGDNIDPDKINTENYEPKLRIVNSEIPSVNEKEEIKLNLQIANITDDEARKIEVTPIVEGTMFELKELAPYEYKNSLSEDEEWNIGFIVKAKNVEDSGTYPLKLKVDYENKFGDSWSEVLTVNIKVNDKKQEDGKIELELSQNDIIAKSGEQFSIKVNVKNNNDYKLKNSELRVENLDSKNLMKYSTVKNISNINAGENTDIEFSFKALDDSLDGTYPIEFEFKTEDQYGNDLIEKAMAYVTIHKLKADLIIGQVQYNTVIEEEEEVTITVPLTNLGEKVADRVKVNLFGNGDLINTSVGTVIIEDLQPGETKNVEFKLKAVKGSKGKSTKLNVTAQYGDMNIESQLGITVEDEESEVSSSKPKLIISKYNSDPLLVKAGKEYDLNLTFLNTHKEKSIENIKITLTTNEGSEKTGSVFTPVNSSNTFFIDKIAPKGERDMMIRLYTIPDAKSKTYIVNVNMEYEYEGESGPVESNLTDMIGIPVRQQSKFMTSDINVPEQISMGQPIRLDIDVSNTGKIDLANFTVKVEGDFQASNSTTYVGNIQPGSREYYTVDLFATKEGENKGTFIFSYEEPSGDIVEVKKEVSTNAIEVQVPEYDNEGEYVPDINNQPLGEKKGFPWVKVAIGGVVVLIAVVIIVRVVKKRKRKKEMELDE